MKKTFSKTSYLTLCIGHTKQTFRFSSKFCEKLGWVEGFIIFILLTALNNRTVLKKTTFNTLNLNCQNEYMINIKCLNKNQGFFVVVFFQIFQPFYKQIKKLGWKVFLKKTFHPIFFICLNFIGAGGNENFKNYLAWLNWVIFACFFVVCWTFSKSTFQKIPSLLQEYNVPSDYQIL